ncbi:MAG: DUF502 domain-containing protein [Verrucomicrobia bacterium]|nr:DUF502 domain-containing protein [Verrucomicrobiota bacterium]
MKSKLLHIITTNFVNGLLIITPLFVTGYIIYRLFLFLDGLIPIEEENRWPGMGVLVLIVSIFLIGLLFTRLLPNPLSLWLNPVLEKAPLLKTLYSSIKDLTSAFVGKKKSFNRPVMVRMNREADIYKLGFITDTDVARIGADEGMVAVYLPHSYNFSGNLFLVPMAHVKPLNAKPADVMKYIVSGGVIDFNDENNAA